jgi:hypothetical protein
MAKKKEETAVPGIEETAVQPTEATNLIGAAIDHMSKAAQMLRSKGGKKAESCAHVAGQIDRWVAQLEKLNDE